MAIQEAKQQHPDMQVTKAVVIRETESPTEELLHQQAEVCQTVWSCDQSAGYKITMLCVIASLTEWGYQSQAQGVRGPLLEVAVNISNCLPRNAKHLQIDAK